MTVGLILLSLLLAPVDAIRLPVVVSLYDSTEPSSPVEVPSAYAGGAEVLLVCAELPALLENPAADVEVLVFVVPVVESKAMVMNARLAYERGGWKRVMKSHVALTAAQLEPARSGEPVELLKLEDCDTKLASMDSPERWAAIIKVKADVTGGLAGKTVRFSGERLVLREWTE